MDGGLRLDGSRTDYTVRGLQIEVACRISRVMNIHGEGGVRLCDMTCNCLNSVISYH